MWKWTSEMRLVTIYIKALRFATRCYPYEANYLLYLLSLMYLPKNHLSQKKMFWRHNISHYWAFTRASQKVRYIIGGSRNFLKEGSDHWKAKKMPKGVHDVCLRARCFHSLYLRLVRLFFGGSVRVCVVGGGGDLCIRKHRVTIALLLTMKPSKGIWGSSPEKIWFKWSKIM